MTKPANLRQAMPLVTAWIDDLRAAFGAEVINPVIKAGMQGVPVFHAEEGGHAVGCKVDERGTLCGVGDMVFGSAADVRKAMKL